MIYIASKVANRVLSSRSNTSHTNTAININDINTDINNIKINITNENKNDVENNDNKEIISSGWETVLRKFWEGNKEYCDQRFKLIPSVVIYCYYYIFLCIIYIYMNI